MAKGTKKRIQYTARVPIGIEKVLYLAASNEPFRTRLFEDRGEALAAARVRLTEVEKRTLLGVPRASLEAMIARISPERHGRRKFMKTVAAATVTLAASVGTEACIEAQPAGIRSDIPDHDVAETTDAPGDEAEVAVPPDGSEGIDAELPVPDYGEEGLRPDVRGDADAEVPVPEYGSDGMREDDDAGGWPDA
jgi:hypothetical protein